MNVNKLKQFHLISFNKLEQKLKTMQILKLNKIKIPGNYQKRLEIIHCQN
jgi:hypothetical protein